MKTTRLAAMMAAVAMVLGAGCADGMSEDEAKTAMSSTALALNAGTGAATAGAVAGFEHGCAGGGAMTLDGQVAGISIGFDIGVKMTTCQRDGVTMDGELTYTMISVNALLVKTLTYSYAGTVSYSGDVAGSCDVAMTGTVTEVSGVLSVATWAGKFCDYDGDKVMAGVDISLGN